MKLIVPNNILMQDVDRELRAGKEVTLLAKGRSMHPYIRDQRDVLVLRRTDQDNLRVGDIVLALVNTDHYVVHRIVEVRDQGVVLMGDGNLYGTEYAAKGDVCGILTHIEREGRRIDCRTPAQQRKAWLMRTLWRTPRRIKHRLKRLLT